MTKDVEKPKFDINKWLETAKPTGFESYPWIQIKPPKGKKKFGYLLEIVSPLRIATIFKKERSVIDVKVVNSNDPDVTIGETYAVSGTRTMMEDWIKKTKVGEVWAVSNQGKRITKDGNEYWHYVFQKVEVE